MKRIHIERTPAEEVGQNEDLLREIFLRLPVRLFVTFKHVSKHWFSIVSDPQFIRHHTLLRNPSSVIASGLLLYDSLSTTNEIRYVSLETVPENSSAVTNIPSLSFLHKAVPGAAIKVLQSINGLILIRFTSQVNDEYCVCNPTTENYTLIPQPKLDGPEKVCAFYLVFEPSESPYYKIICIKSLVRTDINPRKFGAYLIMIYSSENKIWRSCRRCKYFCNVKFNKPAVYWNGILHFVAEDSVRFFEFNIKDEKFEIHNGMHYTSQGYSSDALRYFGECRGHFHRIYVRTPSSKTFRVLEKDGETLEWRVRYRVNAKHFLPQSVLPAGGFPNITAYVFSILYVYKGEKEEDSALILYIPGKIISYNFHYKTVKELGDLPARDHCFTGFYFSESLYAV